MRRMSVAGFEYVYDNYNIYDLAWNSVVTYIIAFLLVDMAYYWFHRAAHEINLFWAAHQTHHSSEEYNLTTALRQSVFQPYTSWVGIIWYSFVCLFELNSCFWFLVVLSPIGLDNEAISFSGALSHECSLSVLDPHRACQ